MKHKSIGCTPKLFIVPLIFLLVISIMLNFAYKHKLDGYVKALQSIEQKGQP
jgi:hypothetical protein